MSRDHLLSDFGVPDLHRALGKGDFLFRRGDETWGVFVLEVGRIELVRAQASGTELTLHRAYPGASFAEAALFSARYHCDCRARIPSRVAVYSRDRITAALAGDPKLTLAWARRLAGQVRDQRALLEVRSITRAQDRILAYLQLPFRDGADTELPSLRSLASELGLAEETVYRSVARLERAGKIERHGRMLRLSDRLQSPT